MRSWSRGKASRGSRRRFRSGAGPPPPRDGICAGELLGEVVGIGVGTVCGGILFDALGVGFLVITIFDLDLGFTIFLTGLMG